MNAQKIQMESQKREMERTVEELSKAEGDVYKSVGSLLIKTEDKEGLRSELEESLETLEIRIRSMDRQEKALREKYESLQETINRALGQSGSEED